MKATSRGADVGWWPAAVALLASSLAPVDGVLPKAVREEASIPLTPGTAAALRKTGVWEAPEPLTLSPLVPNQFLIISSPTQKKIVYTELQDFKTTSGRTFALIDSGLKEPCGIVFDRRRGDLFVADRAQMSIFRYSLLIRKADKIPGEEMSADHIVLTTDGTRLTVLTGHEVEWVAVDQSGALYFTDSNQSSVNKISREVLHHMEVGDYSAQDLRLISQSEQEKLESNRVAAGDVASEENQYEAPRIYSLYEGSNNPAISTPAGVAADGMRLFWVNEKNGMDRGVVVQGQASPRAPPNLAQGIEPGHFPTVPIANNTKSARGLVKTNTLLFYSGTNDGKGKIYGVNQYGGTAYEVATGLGKPQGLVWDGDGTVYVADESKNAVWSFPAGRLVNWAPIAKAVDFSGAYGVALVSHGDPAFSLLNGAPGPSFVLATLCTCIAVFSVF